MKVPTYQRQASYSPETGGRMLTVQADANVFSAPGRAAAQGGQQLFKAGLDWYGHELKLKRATELIKNEQAFQAQSAVIKEELTHGNPEKGIAPWDASTRVEEFQRRSIELRNALSLNINDKVVNTRFQSSAQNQYITNSIEVMKLARVDMVDEAHAAIIEEAQLLEQDLSKYMPGTPAYEEAYRKLLGSDKTKDAWVTVKGAQVLVKGQPYVEGIWEKAARLGIIDQKDVPLKTVKTKQKVALNTVRRQLAVATKAEELDTLYERLNNPNDFIDLAEADRNLLIKQTQKAKQNLESRTIREYNFNIKKDADDRKIRHRNSYKELSDKISKHWREGGANNPPVPVEDIEEAFFNDEISSTMRDSLIDATTNNDALATDNDYYADTLSEIYDAETEEELNAIELKILKEVNPNGKLQRKDWEKLSQKIEAKRENTHEFKVYTYERTNLENNLQGAFPTNTKNPELNVKNQSLINKALSLFEEYTSDPNGPAMPAPEAAKIALEEITRNRVPLVPQVKLNVTFTKDEPKLWSYTMVRQAIQEFKENPKSLTTEQIARQMSYLEEITDYLDSIYNTDKYTHGQDKDANLPPPPQQPIVEDDPWYRDVMKAINDVKNLLTPDDDMQIKKDE